MAREDMRIVGLSLLSDRAKETVLAVLNEEEYDYVVADRTAAEDEATESETAPAIVSVPVPNDAVEPIQRRFAERGIDDDAYTVVRDPEAVVSTVTSSRGRNWLRTP